MKRGDHLDGFAQESEHDPCPQSKARACDFAKGFFLFEREIESEDREHRGDGKQSEMANALSGEKLNLVTILFGDGRGEFHLDFCLEG